MYARFGQLPIYKQFFIGSYINTHSHTSLDNAILRNNTLLFIIIFRFFGPSLGLKISEDLDVVFVSGLPTTSADYVHACIKKVLKTHFQQFFLNISRNILLYTIRIVYKITNSKGTIATDHWLYFVSLWHCSLYTALGKFL